MLEKSSLRFSAYLCALCVELWFDAEDAEIRRGRREYFLRGRGECDVSDQDAALKPLIKRELH